MEQDHFKTSVKLGTRTRNTGRVFRLPKMPAGDRLLNGLQ